MRKPQGYATLVGPLDRGPKALRQGGEADTFTCKHCQRVVHVPPKCDPADLGGLCRICDGLVCRRCHAKGACTPWEEQMRRMEARHEFRRSAGLIG